jgi:Ferritin-like domain
VSDPRLGRREGLRRLVRAAGLVPAVLAFLEDATPVLARGEETDMAVLDGALALEHEAIAVYDLGIRERLFPVGLREHAVEFRGDHLGHRDTQVAIVKERGGRPAAPLPRYHLGEVHGGDDMLRLAMDIELAAQKAYTALISQIRSGDYLLSAAFILIDEVRHLTVWRRSLGQPIY